MRGSRSTTFRVRLASGCLLLILCMWMFTSVTLADPPTTPVLPPLVFKAAPAPPHWTGGVLPGSLPANEAPKDNGSKSENGSGEKKNAQPLGVLIPADALKLDLATAKALALQRQPAIAAARASLAVAVARKQALDRLRVPTCLQPDLPLRRKQSAVGLTAVHAGVFQAELNTIYGAQFAYLSYLFARTQLALADESVERLSTLLDAVAKAVKAAEDPDGKFITDLTRQDVDRISALVKYAEGKREEAVQGVEKALSALREVIGLPAGQPIHVCQDRLLDVTVALDLKTLVNLAMERRPEIIQANVAAEVSQMEVRCQESRWLSPSVRTFASGSDIHVNPLPAGSFDERYSPGAVGPEMPGTINGKQSDRVAQAKIYADRAVMVAEKARGLIRLEVEQAYYRTVESSRKLLKFIEGSKQSERALKSIRESIKDFTEARPLIDRLLNTALVGSQLRVGLNEARYQLLLSLAALERATGGGFCALLEKAPEVSPNELVTVEKKETKEKAETDKGDNGSSTDPFSDDKKDLVPLPPLNPVDSEKGPPGKLPVPGRSSAETRRNAT